MKAPNENDLIRAACDLSYVAEVFHDSASLDPALHGLQVQSAVIVRYKQGKRCLIKYSGIVDSVVELEFLGKIRFKGLDWKTPALQRELRSAGFDGVQGFSVPRVYGELPSLNMWLQEFVSYEKPVSVVSSEFVNVQVPIAKSLARLHRTPISSGKRHTIDDEMALLEVRFQLLRQSRPELSRVIDALQIAMRRGARQFESNSIMTTIHRDFYFDQVLLSRLQTVLVDLDLCCIGPPELDVGNYIGHLREYALRHPDHKKTCKAAEDIFSNTYFNCMQHANQFEAELWANLTLARHVFLSTILPGRAHTTHAISKQALAGFAALFPSRNLGPI